MMGHNAPVSVHVVCRKVFELLHLTYFTTGSNGKKIMFYLKLTEDVIFFTFNFIYMQFNTLNLIFIYNFIYLYAIF